MNGLHRPARWTFGLATVAALAFGAVSALAQGRTTGCYNPPSCHVPGECNEWCLAQNTAGGACDLGCCFCIIE